jgi:glycosyltransferase involved in cell wall biosynthesis
VHVGLNLVYLVPGETGGMETYARELISALVREAPALKMTAFVNLETAEGALGLGPGVDIVTVPVRARSRAQWVWGEQFHLPRLGRRYGIDILHSLGSTSPAHGPFTRVTTIHDVIYHRFPEAHFGLRTLGMRVLVPLSARRSGRIIAVSRCTATDIEQFLHVPADKIDVVHLGLGDLPRAKEDVEPEDAVRRRWALGERPVLLTLSAKRPVKNLERLLDSLSLLRLEPRPVLMMPGYATEHEDRLRRRARDLGLEGDVRMPGWVPAAQIEGLWRVAACFVFPSLYEGFGIPVLEAMGRGVAVACSDRGSLPEVAGSAARYFNPEQPSEIASAIRELVTDEQLRGHFVELGRRRAERFTWSRAAKETLATYEWAISGGRS